MILSAWKVLMQSLGWKDWRRVLAISIFVFTVRGSLPPTQPWGWRTTPRLSATYLTQEHSFYTRNLVALPSSNRQTVAMQLRQYGDRNKGSIIMFRFLTRATEFSHVLNDPEWLWDPHSSKFDCIAVLFPVLKALGRETNHLPPLRT